MLALFFQSLWNIHLKKTNNLIDDFEEIQICFHETSADFDCINKC